MAAQASGQTTQPAETLPAKAQGHSTPSHRHLPLPRDGSQDLMRQFQMMQHLQELVKRQEPSTEESEHSAGTALNPELLKSLSKLLNPDQKAMLESLKGQLGDLSQLDAQSTEQLQEDLGEVLREPSTDAMRAKVEELLRKFSKDRQVPPMQGSEQPNRPIPSDRQPPTSRNSAAADESSALQSGIANEPDASPTSDDAPRSRTGELASRIAEYFRTRNDSASGASRQAGTPTDTNNATTEQRGTPRSQAPSQGERRASPQPNSAGAPNSTRPIQPGRAAGTEQPSREPPGTQRSDSDANPRSRRDAPALQDGKPSPRPNGTSMQSNELTQDTPSSDSGTLGPNFPDANSSDSKTPSVGELPSVPELLKQANEDPASLPPFKLPENSLDLDDIKRLLAERFPKKKNDDDWLSSLKSQLPTSLKAELHKTGLKDSLAEIMEDIKNGNANRDNSTTPNFPNLDQLTKESSGPSLGSIQEELAEVSGALSKSDSPKAEKPKSPEAGKKVPSAEKPEEKGMLTGFSEMYDRWLNGPPDSKDPGAQEPAGDSQDTAGSNTTKFSFSYEGLLAVLLCIGALLAAYMIMVRKQQLETRKIQRRAFRSLKISSREELVKAFHQMVGATGTPTENWWTHRRAAKAVSDLQPAAEPSLKYLNGLYEKARYGPADYQLSEEEYQQACRVLEQIAAC